MNSLRKIICNVMVVVLLLSLIPSIRVSATENNTSDTYVVQEGKFTSASEVKTYEVSLDFTSMTTGVICLVKTGKTIIQMVITDENGQIVKSVKAVDTNARRWVFIDIPSADATVVTYTVTLTPVTYDEDDAGYRLMAGDKKDTEEMISGRKNAVPLDTYTESAGNQFFTYYTPDNYESWYRFTAPSYDETTFTILTKDKDIRFRIVDVDDISNGIYSSDMYNSVHKSEYCGSYGYAEKAKLSMLTSGKEYYLVVYSLTPSGNTSSFIQNTMNITVGKPNMSSGNATYYASSSITGTKTSYSSSATITANTLPKTALVDSIKMKSKTSGVTMSNISYWRVITPKETTWRSSSIQTLKVGYTKDSDNNKSAYGNWKFSFKASSSASSLTMIPGIYISYYYELGD